MYHWYRRWHSCYYPPAGEQGLRVTLLVDHHADLVKAVQHAYDHYIVPSLRVNAIKVDGPSVGLQHAALEPDYPGAPRE